MRRHADAETLAAFREDLLPRRKAGRVSAHLAACPRCAALDAQLAEVTTLLTQSAAPPMPDALTARIEAALAAEAAGRPGGAARPVPAGAPAAVSAGADGNRRDGTGAARPAGAPARGRPRLALRIAAVTAAVAVMAGGGYGVARLLSANSTVTGAGSSAPAERQAAPNAPASAHGALSLPASSAAGLPLVGSGTNYQPGQLKAQLGKVLRRYHAPTGISAGPAKATAGPRLSSPAFGDLAGCVSRLADGQRPLLVDLARYRGHPAAVIVIRAGQPGTLRALVVGPGCAAAASRPLATVSLPSPG